jgi:hypothetical protein
LAARIFSAKHSGMGNKNNRWWHGVPWGWVLASAYGTALVCVAVSQIAGPETAIVVLRDYQTLVAGLATVAALFIAAQQLKRQASRDLVDAVRHYEAEIEAMNHLTKEITRVMNGSSRLAAMYGGPGGQIAVDRSRWERLRQQTHISLAAPISEVLRAVDEYNRLFSDPHTFGWTLGGPDRREVSNATFSVHAACRVLGDEVDERRKVVLQLIEATS